MLGVGLGSTLVVRRRFDPEATLESLDHNQVRAIVVAASTSALTNPTLRWLADRVRKRPLMFGT